MDPELVLAVLALAGCGVVVGLIALSVDSVWPARFRLERAAWWRLMLPLFAGGVVLAFLTGWALQEADPADEHVGRAAWVIAPLSMAVVLRAGARALGALRTNGKMPVPVGTFGLFRPAVLVSEEFRGVVSKLVLEAALAHEAAHLKARDPLRIWMAHLAADLQWPVPGTGRRLSAWRLALEIQRDDEARESGVAGEDLAEAILAAARLQVGPRSHLQARAEGAGDGLPWRVRRLLGEPASSPARWRGVRWLVPVFCLGLLGTALWLGVRYGDSTLRILPGVGP